MEEKKNTFKVLNDKGEEIECEVLFTFKSEETGKNYIAYTDHKKDEKGATQVYASIFDPEKPDGKLIPIETDKEWSVINNILSSLQEEVRKASQETTEEDGQ